MSTVTGVFWVCSRSWVTVRKPLAVTVAISPSSRCTTWLVCRTRAETSLAMYISRSPTPITSGEPLRATTIWSGFSASSTAMA